MVPGVGCPGRKGLKFSREVQRSERREKSCVFVRCPYRKPTQVGRKKILRPTGEGVLRDEPQRIGPSNCLAKTQVCAKSKDDVYGLTPARCWKVKGRCASIELKPQ